MIKKAEDEGRLSGIRLTSSCPSVQHLLFADDSLFMCKANEEECREILRCLELYGQASGQQINFQKSAITFGEGIENERKNSIKNILGIYQEGGAGTYLGLPECFSGSKKDIFGFITDRLKKRLHDWYARSVVKINCHGLASVCIVLFSFIQESVLVELRVR